MKISIIIFAIYFILFFISKCLEVKRLKEEIKRIESSNDRWEDFYKDYIQILEKQIEDLSSIKFRRNGNVSFDTIQAVKYAMKHAHPDNGGNAKDFIKFKECYEELTRK